MKLAKNKGKTLKEKSQVNHTQQLCQSIKLFSILEASIQKNNALLLRSGNNFNFIEDFHDIDPEVRDYAATKLQARFR